MNFGSSLQLVNGWPVLNVGRLDRLVTIQSQAGAPRDSYGQKQQVWTDVLSPWAAIETQLSREIMSALQVTSKVNRWIVIRYRPDLSIAPDQRAVYGPRTFRIETVDNVNARNVAIVLQCEELYGVS